MRFIVASDSQAELEMASALNARGPEPYVGLKAGSVGGNILGG